MELTLASNVQYLPGVGPVKARLLSKIGINSVEDLLFYAPFRYNDFTITSPIAGLQPGEVVTVRGRIVSMRTFMTKNRKKIQQAQVKDESGTIQAIWFNQPYLVTVMPVDSDVSLSGEASWFGRKLTLISPQYEILSEGSATIHTGRLVPVYSETAGLTSKWLRARMHFALIRFLGLVKDPLPVVLRRTHQLMPLRDALAAVHFPNDAQSADQARHRLSFDEMFLMQLRAYYKRRLRETTQTSRSVSSDPIDVARFVATLPFTLTDDQRRTVGELLTDLKRTVPMNRLLVGDVGAGKTVVATVAIFACWKSGFRSVLMAPTEILAKQHFHTVSGFLAPLGVRVGLFTGSVKSRTVSDPNLFSEENAYDIYVGTHALLSASVDFDDCALVVIDEQQRFGVLQRTHLKQKAKKSLTPHLLTMTATPIPRSVALTFYGNLDLSTLSELPKGRHPVKTWAVPNAKREGAYRWMREQLTRNHAQAFIVCPLIEESETLATVRATTAEYTRLSRDVFPELRLSLLHGRMKPREKDLIMASFRSHSSDILVTTPVVEVGIDVPNATIMLIEAAERFGLAQLHQLRGRVGRGEKSSYCLLFTEKDDEKTLARLHALEKYHSGPELAQIDLTLRGPGDIFGTKQHGLPVFTVASFADAALIDETKQAINTLTGSDPELGTIPDLRERLKRSTIPATSQD